MKKNEGVDVTELFYVVADNSEEGWEQITNGLQTYQQAEDYMNSDFCKSRWENSFIVKTVNKTKVEQQDNMYSKDDIKLFNETLLCLGDLRDLADGYENDFVNFKKFIKSLSNKSKKA